ncbi:MAG: ABC transporter permease [Syntrophales bacterium]|nr:ABC transporter permease [Syntrophales bacterium]
MAFALPLLLILLFGYALSLDVDNVKVVIVDHDRTDLSRDFASRLDASAYFDLVSVLPDDGAAAAWLDAGKATIALGGGPRTSARTARRPCRSCSTRATRTSGPSPAAT